MAVLTNQEIGTIFGPWYVNLVAVCEEIGFGVWRPGTGSAILSFRSIMPFITNAQTFYPELFRGKPTLLLPTRPILKEVKYFEQKQPRSPVTELVILNTPQNLANKAENDTNIKKYREEIYKLFAILRVELALLITNNDIGQNKELLLKNYDSFVANLDPNKPIPVDPRRRR